MKSQPWELRTYSLPASSSRPVVYKFKLTSGLIAIRESNEGKFYATIDHITFGYTSSIFDDPNDAYAAAVARLDQVQVQLHEIRKNLPLVPNRRSPRPA